MSLIDKLQWRYATKKFDPTKKLSDEQLDELLTAVQLSPSSAGLQAYRIIVVSDAEIKAKLREAARGQAQLTDASHIIVFAAETNVDTNYVANYITRIAETRAIPRETLAGFETSISAYINSQTEDQQIIANQKQAYIALGVLASAAADLGIDACPMEGFEPGKFDEILGLREKGLTTSVIAPVGFRSPEDKLATAKKVRRPKEELFIHL